MRVEKRRESLLLETLPTTPLPGRFMIKLPPSRPPSPSLVITYATAAADFKVLYDLIVALPRPSYEHKATKLAREAVDEAFEGFRVVPALLDVAKNRALVAGDAAWQILQMTTEMPTYGVFCYMGSWYNGTDQ